VFRRGSEQSFGISVAANYSVECYDIGLTNHACDQGEITQNKLNGLGHGAPFDLASRDINESRRGLHKGGAGNPYISKFPANDTDSAANVEEVFSL